MFFKTIEFEEMLGKNEFKKPPELLLFDSSNKMFKVKLFNVKTIKFSPFLLEENCSDLKSSRDKILIRLFLEVISFSGF
jgi:hypothetical protein